jgi:hypothetical protein
MQFKLIMPADEEAIASNFQCVEVHDISLARTLSAAAGTTKLVVQSTTKAAQ